MVRIIDTKQPRNEAEHHALDQAILEELDNQNSEPALRIWYRKNKAIPFGRFQSYQDEVNEDYANRHNIEIVRRITGGGAMYVEPGDVITYSLYLPQESVTDNIIESYSELDRWAVRALQQINVDARHEPINDIMHNSGKIGGAAQLRKQNAVLHHATMSYDLDTAAMIKALKIGKEKISDKAVSSAEKRVTCIADHTEHDRQAVINTLKESFKNRYGGNEQSLTAQEQQKTKQLVADKFNTESWTKHL